MVICKWYMANGKPTFDVFGCQGTMVFELLRIIHSAPKHLGNVLGSRDNETTSGL
jgi:hypothetical protein